jgi:hypothetical protein
MIYQSFGLKITRAISPGLASQSVATVSWFCLKTVATIFSGLTSKPVVQISQFGPKN